MKSRFAVICTGLMFAAAAALRADTGLITTFAGNGVAGSGGVGGPAVSANLNKPYCLSSDAAGNIYVANGGSGAINKIDAATSVITHLTNVMSGSYSVPGAVSQIFPCVASDSAGNLYISDAGNHRLLRRDVATGNITTIAGTGSVAVNDPGDGGPATAAGLSYPTYVVLDAQNNIYVSQAFNHRVRRIDAATGNISTVAGTGVGGYNGDGIAAVSAMLNQPWGLATDVAGNLYIAETLGYRIRKVNVTSGIITTAVGSGVAPTDFVDPNASFNGDNIPALAANLRPIDVAVDSTGNILVSTHLRLRRVNAATGMIQSIAGMGNWTQDGVQATHAVTGVIGGIKVLPNGNILIAESQYHRVRKIAYPSSLPYTVTTLTSDETVWGNNGPVRLNVSVTASNGSSPTGRVYFLWDNGASTGSVDLVNGSAVYQSQPQGLGTRVVRAHYVSDYTNFQHGGSASPNLSLEVKRGATVTISTSPATIGPNDPVTVTVGVTGDYGAGLNGYVELLDGSIPLGTATLANGTATFQTSFSTNGVHVLTARYPGDSYYAPASRTYNQYVMAPTTVTLTATPSNPVYGQAVTLTATSSPATPTGGAFFYDNGMWIGSASATNGSAVFSTSSLSPGAHSLTVLFTPYEPGWLSGNGATTVTVAKASTSTALTLATPSVTIGAVAAFTALVTPSPASGTVQFLNGATVLGTANLVGGTASFSTSALGVGTHSIQAVYSGDTNYLTSTSAAASQTITKGTSTASLAVTPNPSTYLQPATLSAAVTPASATGTVQFLDGATVLGTVPVVSGAASIVVSNLAGGAHSLKAVYSGDSTYNGAASAAIAHTVNPASSLIAISLGSANPAVYGQVTAINVTVSFTTEPGTVRFFDGATQIASTTVLNGSGSAVVNGLGVGTHSLTAQFIGNSNFAPSTSTAITLVINKAASTLSLTRNPGSSVYGQTVTLTATASPVGATGVVTFRDGATVLGTATLNNGVATLAVSTLSVATHSLSATYAGDANFLAFTTAAQSHVVAKAPTTTTVVSSLNPSRRNQAVTFTATVVAPGATGQVRFFNGSSTLGTVNLLNGVAAYTASSFSQGTKSITARYLGDSNYLTSTSPVLSQVVNK